MPDWLGLEGQRVVVAGGAGTIGSALVTGFADAGASVGVIDLDVSNIDSRAVSATAQADLSDPDAARRTRCTACAGQLGGLDGLVHCVGINDRKPIEDYTGSEWDRIVSVNLTSAFHLATQAAVVMREQRRGRIVFFSSVAGRSGHKLHGPYAATKGAINQLMRVIAHEYAAHGVTANAVAPGYMDTELTAPLPGRQSRQARGPHRVDPRRPVRHAARKSWIPCCSCARPARASSPGKSCTSTAAARSSKEAPMQPRFEGKTFMVTGAGTGFGAALSLRAAQEGAGKVHRPLPQLVRRGRANRGARAARPAPRRSSCRATSPRGPTSSGWRQWAFDEVGGVDVLDQQRRRHGIRSSVVDRGDRGGDRPRAGRRHQGHDVDGARVRAAHGGARRRRDRQRRVRP